MPSRIALLCGVIDHGRMMNDDIEQLTCLTKLPVELGIWQRAQISILRTLCELCAVV